MTENRHPNSRLITVFRNRSFMDQAQTKEVQNYLDEGAMAIGAYFEGSSDVVATGLRTAEVKILLPIQLSMHPSDQEFNKAVRRFYNAIETKVPMSGTTLEVGLEKSNSSPVSEDNLPIKLIDYLRYRHLIEHPFVAVGKDAAAGNQLKKYYVFSEVEEEQKIALLADVRDKALSTYLEVTREKDEEKMNAMMLLLGEDFRPYASSGKKQDWLKAYAEKEPKKFVDAHSTHNFDDVVWLRKMKMTGVVKEINGTLYITSSQKVLGNSEAEALMVLRNPEEKELYHLLKSSVQENLKKASKSKAFTPGPAKPVAAAPSTPAPVGS